MMKIRKVKLRDLLLPKKANRYQSFAFLKRVSKDRGFDEISSLEKLIQILFSGSTLKDIQNLGKAYQMKACYFQLINNNASFFTQIKERYSVSKRKGIGRHMITFSSYTIYLLHLK